MDPTTPPASRIAVDACSRTDVGLVRERNEDHALLGDLDQRQPCLATELLACSGSAPRPLFVVCDGLGGAAAGEVASSMATEIIWEEMTAAQATDDRIIYARLLRRAVRVANRRIWESGRRERKHKGMGTTVSAAGLVDGALVLAQVGDSRAYVLRGDELVQVTRDQSVISALVRSGRMPEHVAQHLPESNMVLQALGVRRDVEVAISVVELRRGDVLLVCSDGLHGPVPLEFVRAILGTCPTVELAADELVEAARSAGAPDNVTAIVARFSGDLPEPAGADDLPRYAELDPAEEGARAIADTSVIARRLAARIGIGEDPGPPVVPATGQFTAMRRSAPTQKSPDKGQDKLDGASGDAPTEPEDQPASSALARGARVSRLFWVAIVCAALAAAALVIRFL